MIARLAAYPDDAADRRIQPRPALDRPGTLRTTDDTRFDVTVSDLTRDGCRLHTGVHLAPGQKVSVGLAHVGIITATVVWHGSSGYGCRFDSPLAAGMVSAAFGGSNVQYLAGPGERPASTKLGPRPTLAIIAAATAGGWLVIAASLWQLLSS